MPLYQMERMNTATKAFEAIGPETELLWWVQHVQKMASREDYPDTSSDLTYYKGIYRIAVTDTSNSELAVDTYMRDGDRTWINFTDTLIPAELRNADFYSKVGSSETLDAIARDMHIDENQPEGTISFFTNVLDQCLQKPTHMKVSKFVAKYLGFKAQEASECAQHFAGKQSVTWQLLENTYSDDNGNLGIVEAYQQGPDSCMSHEPDSYFSTQGIHPCAVYGKGKHGNSDISLLIVRRGNRITGRVLVWVKETDYNGTKRGIFGRIYGDGARVRKSLRELGEFSQGDFDGANLNLIELTTGDIVCAYLDFCQQVHIHSDHLEISPCGSHTGNLHEHGILNMEPLTYCEECSEHHHEDDLTYVEAGEGHYCEGCLGENFFYCDYTHEWVPHSDAIQVRTSAAYYGYSEWSNAALENGDCYFCDNAAEFIAYEFESPIFMFNGETWSESAFDAEGGTCLATKENFPRYELVHNPAIGGLVSIEWARKRGFKDLFPETIAA